MKTYAYTLSSPDDELVMYVGISIDPDKCYRAHLTEGSGSPKGAWIRGLRDAGKYPIMQVIDHSENASEPDHAEEVKEMEKMWITYFLEKNPDLLNEAVV